MNEQLLINICFFIGFSVIPVFCIYFLYSWMLTPKNKLSKIFILLILPVINIILTVIPGFTDTIPGYLIIMAYTLTGHLFFIKESKLHGLFCGGLIQLIMLTVDVVFSSVVFEVLGYYPSQLEPKQWSSIIFTLTYQCFFMFTALLVGSAWRKKYKQATNRSMMLFALFPIGQLMFFAAASYEMWDNGYRLMSNPFILFALAVSVISDIFMFIALRDNTKMEEIKLQMLEMQHNLEMQYQYYENIIEKQNELREYRHDINNLVSVVESLVEKNISLSEGAKLTADMKKKSQETIIPTYCANPVVNTILWHKRKTAYEKGIVFEIEIDPSEDFPIERIDICSLFTNLIDNAVREAEKYENTVIEIKAKRNIGMIFIEVTNHCEYEIASNQKPRSTKKGDHGYGIEIIRKIAEKYDGELALFTENKKAVARICINPQETIAT